ncbi:hypothetical protein EON65_56165, partial [archaeon]
MFLSEEDLPEDVESLQALVLDLSRRLQNSQHTIEAERKISSQALQQVQYYRDRLTEMTSSFRVEAARIRNSEMKYKREKDARKYDENKAKLASLVEELRVAELDCQMAGMTKFVPVKVQRLRAKVSALDSQQQSLRKMLTQMSEIETMNDRLITCAQSNHVEEAMTLLQAGADVNYVDSAGYLALHYACSAGHIEITQLLLEQGSDYTARLTGHAPAILAAKSGHNQIIELLLAHGADIEEKGLGGCPATIAALEAGQSRTLQFLLEQCKADINSKDAHENTLLHHAVRMNVSEAADVMRYLLDHGINPNKVNRADHTAVQVALHEKHKLAYEILTGKELEDDELGMSHPASARERLNSGARKLSGRGEGMKNCKEVKPPRRPPLIPSKTTKISLKSDLPTIPSRSESFFPVETPLKGSELEGVSVLDSKEGVGLEPGEEMEDSLA